MGRCEVVLPQIPVESLHCFIIMNAVHSLDFIHNVHTVYLETLLYYCYEHLIFPKFRFVLSKRKILGHIKT